MKPIRSLGSGGGLINILQANAIQPIPSLGDGATILHYSDRIAGTVVSVETIGKSVYVGVQRDIAVRTDKFGMSESQSYRYERNPKVEVYYFKLRSDDRWIGAEKNLVTGRFRQTSGGVRFGVRDEYFDFSF